MARKSRKNIETIESTVSKAPSMYNAAAYVRLSSDASRKRGDSLETQQDIIENYIATMPDIRLEEIYIDNHTTGTNFERPGFQRMLADVENGRINCIIVKDISRFGRNAIDAGYYIEKHLPSLGVRFIAVTDDFDSLDENSDMLLPLKSLIAESYALDISRKCRSVKQQNIRDGRFVGRLAPYGYAKAPDDCHRLVIDEEAAAVVRQIFGWAMDGMRIGEITRALNAANILTPSRYKRQKGLLTNKKLIGVPYWQHRTVRELLRDQVYVGDMVQGKTCKDNDKEVNIPQEQWICVPNTHKPIISRETFAQVQMRLQQITDEDKATRQAAVPYTPHIFKGKIFCAHCGYPMHRHRQNKDGTYWYRCQSQWKHHSGACYPVSVKEEELKKGVFALLHRHITAIMGGVLRLEHSTPSANAEIDTELDGINRQLSSNSVYLKSLYENMVSGVITPDEFSTMREDYANKIKALSKRADELRATRREQTARYETWLQFADAALSALADAALSTEIIEQLVASIHVSRDKSFEIVLRFQDEFQEVQRVG